MNKEPTNTIKEILADPDANGELKDIVLARIQVMPDTINIAIGNEDLSKKQLLEHVNREDGLGTQIMEMELEYLQDLASGAIYLNE